MSFSQDERLLQFPAKPTPVPTDIIYVGDSADGFNEVQCTIAQVVNAYPTLFAIAGLSLNANSVLVTDNSGNPSFSNTLPVGVVVPDTVSPTNLVKSTYTYAIDSGSVNAYAATYTGFISIADGGVLSIRAANTNTGASTFNPSGSGALGIVLNTGKTLVGGEIRAGGDYHLQASTHFSGYILLNPSTVPTTQTDLTSGSGTYTTPTGCTRLRIRGVGAGGAGGGAENTAGQNAAGAGGGGGGYFEHIINNPAASYAYSIGSGGVSGTPGAHPGGDGGDTTFGGILTANGGTGGNYGGTGAPFSISGSGGLGGNSSGGNVMNAVGSNGGTGFALANNLCSAGFGGGTVLGGAINLANNTTSGGVNGVRYGGGGSGGATLNGGGAQSGGNGNNGAIFIEEFYI